MKLHRLILMAILPVLLLVGIACGGTSATPTTGVQPTAVVAATSVPATAAPPTATLRPGETSKPTATPRPAATRAPQPTAVAGAQLVEPRLKITIPQPVDQQTVFYKVFGSDSILRPLYDHLIYADPLTHDKRPMLASEWAMSPDGLNWSFKLVKGATFHPTPLGFEGDEFTAKDVIRSFDMMDAPGNRPHNVPAMREKVVTSNNIEVINDYEVVFRLLSPWATLPDAVWSFRGDVMTIYSAKYWDDFGQETYENHPTGTGPFKFVELVINEHILFERFKEVGDDHWWQIPGFDEMQIFFVPEAATRLAQLVAEEAHIASLPVLLIEEAKRKGFEINLSTAPGAFLFGVFSGQNHRAESDIPEIAGTAILDGHRKPHGLDVYWWPDDPLVQLKVRQAMNHAIDRQQLKDSFFGERASLDAVHGMYPFQGTWDDSWIPYEFKPDLARQLLAEAGYPDDSIKLTVRSSEQWTSFPEGADVAESIVAMWQDVGIDATLVIQETSEVFLRARKFTVTRNEISIQQFGVTDTELLWNAGIRGPGSSVFYDGVLDDVFVNNYQTALLPEEREKWELFYGQRMYDLNATIPLFAAFGEAAINPGVVAEFNSNYSNVGPTMEHEFTIPVYK